MFANQAGANLPVMLPYLDPIFEELQPTYGAMWFDEDGLRGQSNEGASMSIGAVGGAAVGVAVMLPAL